MMSKRRQTLGFQILGALALLCFAAYFLVPLSDQGPRGSLGRANPPVTNAPLAKAMDTKHMGETTTAPVDPYPHRIKAAFVVLARNSDLDGIRISMRQIEDRFNRKFNYPYVFLNEQTFTTDFKQLTSALTNGKTYYGKIDPSMWGYPDHINTTYAAECRQKMGERKIIYGDSEPYRHMCRFQSGFFFRHPLLDQFDYYWRLEPHIQYFCDINYDVFRLMQENDFKYGWTLSLTEYMETIPTLWKTTQEFMEKNPGYLVTGEDSILPWATDDDYVTYNGCHFWSNFEIGSLSFLRSERYLKYFEHLDKAGGFFYERWGDAPVHSLAVAMFLKKSEVHFFNDIGYMHNPLQHCPTERYLQKHCHCEKSKNFDWEGWSCATRFKDRIDNNFVWDEFTFRNKTSHLIP